MTFLTRTATRRLWPSRPRAVLIWWAPSSYRWSRLYATTAVATADIGPIRRNINVPYDSIWHDVVGRRDQCGRQFIAGDSTCDPASYDAPETIAPVGVNQARRRLTENICDHGARTALFHKGCQLNHDHAKRVSIVRINAVVNRKLSQRQAASGGHL